MSERFARTGAGVAVAALVLAGCADRLPPPAVAPSPSAAARRDLGPLIALGWTADRVGAGGDRVQPDGLVDYAFRVRISGPVRALVLVSSDTRGLPCCGDVWDTLRAPFVFPDGWGLPNVPAAATWSIAVEDGASRLLNPEVTLPETLFRDEHVTIFAPDPPRARFVPGRTLTLLVVRPDGTLDRTTTTLL